MKTAEDVQRIETFAVYGRVAQAVGLVIEAYGPIPRLDGIRPEKLFARLVHDKKTVQGKVHFVLPVRIGEVTVVSGVDERRVMDAIGSALA